MLFLKQFSPSFVTNGHLSNKASRLMPSLTRQTSFLSFLNQFPSTLDKARRCLHHLLDYIYSQIIHFPYQKSITSKMLNWAFSTTWAFSFLLQDFSSFHLSPCHTFSIVNINEISKSAAEFINFSWRSFSLKSHKTPFKSPHKHDR